MNGWRLLMYGSLAVGGTVGLGIAGRAMYRGARALYDDAFERWQKYKHTKLTLERIATQNALNDQKAIYPDERGRWPMVRDRDGNWLEVNTMRQFTIQTVRHAWPFLENIDAKIRAVVAAGGWPTPATAQAMLPDQTPATAAVDLPTRVPLSGLLDGPPSWRRLVLGVTTTADGRREIVTGDLGQLVHVAVGGSSGWGKSVFLRSAAYQLAKSADPVDLALIDLEGATFAPFAQCDRLLWPVADTETDAAAILCELEQELDRRKALFAQHPGVDSLSAYNARADEYLSPVVCIIDEATALLENRDVESRLRTLALRARKYGVWLWLCGQDWKASSIDTAIRNQLATRVQFKAMSDSQSRVLLQRSGAEEIAVKGRALAWIPGRDLITLQAPIIGYDDILVAVGGDGPQGDMPADARAEGERIRDLTERGLSRRQIELAVFGYTGGAAHTKVGEVLGATTVADRRATAPDGDLGESATVVAPEGGRHGA